MPLTDHQSNDLEGGNGESQRLGLENRKGMIGAIWSQSKARGVAKTFSRDTPRTQVPQAPEYGSVDSTSMRS